MHYRNCDELPLFNWEKYTLTQDNNWFLIDYRGQNPIESEELLSIESNILDEVALLSKNNSFLTKLKKHAQINALVTKYNIVSKICKRIGSGQLSDDMRLQFIDVLAGFRYVIKKDNTYPLDLIRVNEILQDLQGIETQILIIKSELKEERKDISINKKLRIVESGLHLAYKIDKKTTTLTEWFEMLEQLNEIKK